MTTSPRAQASSESNSSSGKNHSQFLSGRGRLLALAISIGAVFFLYSSTFASMIRVWTNSATFVHGFLIVPISIYLIWRKRELFRAAEYRTFRTGFALLLLLSLTWLVSHLLGIQVGEHFAAVGLIPVLVFTILGYRAGVAIAFPLAYLFFAVPFGEALVPWLMEFTASFTVKSLQLTGIPVIRDELYFAIPAGNFEVAKACSGIRYLLATLSLATLYAYMVFSSLKKRLVFLCIAIIVPIIANAIRAYGIVMIAHLSDMRFAVGADHLLYGWVFFGLVIGALFWIGNRFHDEAEGADVSVGVEWLRGNKSRSDRPGEISVVAVLAIVCLAIGPVLAHPTATDSNELTLAAVPESFGSWKLIPVSNGDWYPLYSGASLSLHGRYTNGIETVDLAVIQYDSLGQGAEIASSTNLIADTDHWQTYREGEFSTPERDGTSVDLNSVMVGRGNRARHILYWYDVNGDRALSKLSVKFLEGKHLLRRDPVRSTLIAVSLAGTGDESMLQDVLVSFLGEASFGIEECIRNANAPVCASSESHSIIR